MFIDPLHPRGLRSPLVLHCGHSACEKCVRTAVNDIGRVICGVCKQISTAIQNKTDLREDFPLNLYLLGIYAFRHWGQEPEDSKVAFVPAGASSTGHKTSASSLKAKEHKKGKIIKDPNKTREIHGLFDQWTEEIRDLNLSPCNNFSHQILLCFIVSCIVIFQFSLSFLNLISSGFLYSYPKKFISTMYISLQIYYICK